MRIRKKFPPPSPPRPPPYTQLQGQRTTPQGNYCSRCFAVVEENRRIGWNLDSLDDSHHLLGKEDIHCLVCSEQNKEDENLCMLHSPNQMEAFKGGDVPTEKRSTSVEDNLRETNSYGSGSSYMLAFHFTPSEQVEEEEVSSKKQVKTKNKVKAEKSKKKDQEYDDGETSVNPRRGRRRNNALMEGSRCTRVNGRGWRCKEITSVGYSLCEHHLGQARVRSMTNNGTKNAIPSVNNDNVS